MDEPPTKLDYAPPPARRRNDGWGFRLFSVLMAAIAVLIMIGAALLAILVLIPWGTR